MASEIITIPFMLESINEREITESMSSQLQGIKNVLITPTTHNGVKCNTVTIMYEKRGKAARGGSHCPSQEEWTKSRNYP